MQFVKKVRIFDQFLAFVCWIARSVAMRWRLLITHPARIEQLETWVAHAREDRQALFAEIRQLQAERGYLLKSVEYYQIRLEAILDDYLTDYQQFKDSEAVKQYLTDLSRDYERLIAMLKVEFAPELDKRTR